MADVTPITQNTKKQTTDFSGKTTVQVASILKAEAGGIKRNAEQRIWPQMEKATANEDKVTHAFWAEVIHHLCENTEDPKVPTVDPVGHDKAPAGAELSLA